MYDDVTSTPGHQTDHTDATGTYAPYEAALRASLEATNRIRLGDTHERLAWCDWLGCSEDELRDAVRAVGPMLQDVKRKLGKIL